MEWSKAKNILIMIFLALNLFLGYSLWEDIYLNYPSRIISQKEIEEAEARLEAVNLELKINISPQIFTMSFLTVSNQEQQGEILAEKLLDPEQPFSFNKGTEGTPQVYRQDKNQIYIWENGRVIFTREPMVDLEQSQDEVLEEGAAISLAEEYLENAQLLPVDARLEEVHSIGDNRYQIRYNQVYKNQTLYGGYLLVQITPRGLEQFELYWLDPQGFSGQEMNNISAAAALGRLADSLEPFSERTAVESMNIGYYSEVFDAQKWDMVPVWRIRLSNRRTYYINAYTGELEGIEEL
ncbi:two-component system regulatory protein YycI [Candidatus Contubernalis alkaliaceticus]|uniref:two-component system regulatory protein YycI n=1 Tax=Candidatus Contubernalis alkaliaceticus TaxID=338645 RepID=UPI001F4C3150|nr:two-component system regulatory protein YycI [Candidatus Contubernalis alkalaceticus]UNC93702.1 two-component system regulatory protein YycI [Candidatus Contubernalis alkalaceticus]